MKHSEGEGASRSASEPDSASLRKSRVAKLPDWTKPRTVGEAADECSQRALRGGWGQRVPIDKFGNLRDPTCRGCAPNDGREFITVRSGVIGSRMGP